MHFKDEIAYLFFLQMDAHRKESVKLIRKDCHKTY